MEEGQLVIILPWNLMYKLVYQMKQTNKTLVMAINVKYSSTI